MNEHHVRQSEQAEPEDVEQRLMAYYGPKLPERTLPPAAWQDVRHRLGTQAGTRYRSRLCLPRKRSRAYVPMSLHEAFARIASEAGVPSTPEMLRCRLSPHVHEPAVRGSWLGRRTIRLTLPLDAVLTMGQDELDVLLATGLARSLAFHADTLMVHWLGRSHACSGLHALAERRPASRRGHWGEPSLAERVERVCGTPVEARENRLTLVG